MDEARRKMEMIEQENVEVDDKDGFWCERVETATAIMLEHLTQEKNLEMVLESWDMKPGYSDGQVQFAGALYSLEDSI